MKDDRHNIVDEDAALVASWRRGELSSFEALVRKYQKRMLNIAFRITDDYEDACEVTQDAFVAAFKGIESFRGAARFSTWLTSITLNLSRNRQKVDVSDPRLADRVADNVAKFEATESESILVGTGFGTTPNIVQGPDGNLYVVSITDGAIYRISAK